MSDEEDDDSGNERRSAPGRRRYNRRTGSGESSPPYFEVFERIARALECIAESLPQVSPPNEIRLPQDDPDASRHSGTGSGGRAPRP